MSQWRSLAIVSLGLTENFLTFFQLKAENAIAITLRSCTATMWLNSASMLNVAQTNQTGNTSAVPGNSLPDVATRVFAIIVMVIDIATVAANLLVLLAFIQDRRVRLPRNYYILNLAVSDFITAAISTPFYVVTIFQEGWPFGREFCAIWTSIDLVCRLETVLSILLITHDRYCLVKDPVAYHVNTTSRSKPLRRIIISWIGSALIRMPFIVFSHVWVENNGLGISCSPYSDIDAPFRIGLRAYDFTYTITSVLCEYFAPLVCIIYWNLHVYRFLRARSRKVLHDLVLDPWKPSQRPASQKIGAAPAGLEVDRIEYSCTKISHHGPEERPKQATHSRHESPLLTPNHGQCDVDKITDCSTELLVENLTREHLEVRQCTQNDTNENTKLRPRVKSSSSLPSQIISAPHPDTDDCLTTKNPVDPDKSPRKDSTQKISNQHAPIANRLSVCVISLKCEQVKPLPANSDTLPIEPHPKSQKLRRASSENDLERVKVQQPLASSVSPHGLPLGQSVKKAALVMVVITALFVIVRTPYVICRLYALWCLTCIPDLMYQAAFWLGWSLSLANPFLFAFISKAFKDYCHQLLAKLKRTCAGRRRHCCLNKP